MSPPVLSGDNAIEKIEPLDPPWPSPHDDRDHIQAEYTQEEHEEDQAETEPPEEAHSGRSSDEPEANRLDLSRTVSAQSRPISLRKVPTSQRCGLCPRLSILYEADDPKGYPRKIKWFITFNIALAAVAAPMGSSIILREHFWPSSLLLD